MVWSAERRPEWIEERDDAIVGCAAWRDEKSESRDWVGLRDVEVILRGEYIWR